MLKTLSGIISNSMSNNRNQSYGLVSTISKGYDAAAVSALVHKLGCDKALTFTHPIRYKCDSGEDLAHRMGFKEIIKGDANEYLSNHQLLEAEAASCGDVGCLVSFSTFSNHYENCLLFLGLKGDAIWGMNEPNANTFFDLGDMTIAAEQNPEHFLNHNTIAISVPLLLGDHWPDIHTISNSPEMAEYSVGGNYDRPIPRKIVESEGIERKDFGQSKRGAGFTYRFEPTFKSVANKMSPSSYQSLIIFKKNFKYSKLKYFINKLQYYQTNYPIYLGYVANKLHIKYKRSPQFYTSSPISSILIQWGVSVIKNKYIDALKNNNS